MQFVVSVRRSRQFVFGCKCIALLATTLAWVSPLRAANLELALNADFVAGSLGQPVTYWPDVSDGFFRDALAPAAAQAPLLQLVDLGVGPFNVLQFDGVDDYLRVGGFNVRRGDYTVFVVAAVDPGELEGAFFSSDAGGWNNLDSAVGVGRMNTFGPTPPSTFGMESHGPSVNTNNGAFADATQDDGVFRVFWARAAGAQYSVGVNYGLINSATSTQPGMFGAEGFGADVGRRQASDYFAGRIAEIQVWSGAMDDAQVADSVATFTTRYGLDGSIGGPPRPPLFIPVAAGALSVPAGATTNAASVWTVVGTGPAPGNITVITPPNIADVGIGVSDGYLLASDGIMLATIRENRTAAPFFTAEVVQEGAFNSSGFGFINAMSVATADAPAGTERNGNVAVAFFPFTGGWTGAHVGSGGGIEISNNVVQEDISTIGTGRYRVQLPGVHSQADGLLFGVGGANEDNYSTIAAMPDGAWEVSLIDNGANFPTFGNDDFSFVYIPLSALNLVAGKINSNGTIDFGRSVGDYTVTRLGTGTYEITVLGKTPDTGVLVLNNVSLVTSGGVTAAEDNYLTYAADATGTKFVIMTRDFPNSTLQDKDFAFAYIDYVNPPALVGVNGPQVPEPSAAALVAVAACAWFAARRRRCLLESARRARRTIAIVAVAILSLPTSAKAVEKKVFVIGVDGLRPDAMMLANAPNIAALVDTGAYNLKAQGEDLTFSGPNWSSILHGVHRDLHNVNTNDYAGNNLAAFPDFLSRLESNNPAYNTVRAISWPNIANQPTSADVNFNANDNDAAVVSVIVDQMTNGNPDAVFIHLLDVDHAGHSCADCYQPTSPVYMAEIADVDAQIGQMLSAMRARPTFANEDWLVLLVADHGGMGSGHSGNTPVLRTIPFVMNGPSVAPGQIFPPPKNVDVLRTVLSHMNVPAEQFSDADGHAVGFSPTAPPPADFGVNLLFNGDAEFDRGFSVHNQFDQYVSGWDDPGNGENNPRMTVVQYGAGHWLSPFDPGSDIRGVNMFIGGVQDDARISQRVDVADLAALIDAGSVEFSLSGFLGGRGAERDIARVSARFLDENGGFLSFGQIGPVTPLDRGNLTQMLLRETEGTLPVGTRTIEVTLVMTRLDGPDNDGYADDLSLILSTSLTPGDANGDGVVDRTDIAIVGANFGLQSGATRAQGDFDGDHMVTLNDLGIAQINQTPALGDSPANAAVPEPAGLLLATLTLAALAVASKSAKFLKGQSN
jgi:hypothetical protein